MLFFLESTNKPISTIDPNLRMVWIDMEVSKFAYIIWHGEL